MIILLKTLKSLFVSIHCQKPLCLKTHNSLFLHAFSRGASSKILFEFLKFIDDDQSILEKEPLESIVDINQLAAYKHNGFWQCMDTKRDRDKLEDIFSSTKFC